MWYISKPIRYKLFIHYNYFLDFYYVYHEHELYLNLKFKLKKLLFDLPTSSNEQVSVPSHHNSHKINQKNKYSSF